MVAALGDSITAGSPAYAPDPAAPGSRGTGDPRSQYEYWARRADPELRFRNCGVPGERTDEIARRLDACARGADVLVIQGGINDIAQSLAAPPGARLATVAAAARNLSRMARRGNALGLEVELTDLLPWNNGDPYATPLVAALNRRIGRIGRRLSVPVLPFHDVLENPLRPGLMKAEWTAEGDHPSIDGYRRLGEMAFRLP